jgi:hypothetical protein
MEQDQFDLIARLRARQRRRIAPALTSLEQGVCYAQPIHNKRCFTIGGWGLGVSFARGLDR